MLGIILCFLIFLGCTYESPTLAAMMQWFLILGWASSLMRLATERRRLITTITLKVLKLTGNEVWINTDRLTTWPFVCPFCCQDKTISTIHKRSNERMNSKLQMCLKLWGLTNGWLSFRRHFMSSSARNDTKNNARSNATSGASTDGAMPRAMPQETSKWHHEPPTALSDCAVAC